MHIPETIITLTTCYTLMFIISWIRSTEKNNRLFDTEGSPAANMGSLLSLHVAGIIWFGIVPMLISDQRVEIFFKSNELSTRLGLLILILLVIIIFTGIHSSRRIHLKFHELPEEFANALPVYFILRLLFLCSYEIFFRGILLFYCAEWIGIIPAIAISTTLTVLVHLFTNKREMIGCVPFGIILSIVCLELHAVWPAIILHIALSFSYELPPVKHFIFYLKLSK